MIIAFVTSAFDQWKGSSIEALPVIQQYKDILPSCEAAYRPACKPVASEVI